MARKQSTRRNKIDERREPTPKYQKTIEILPKTPTQDRYIRAIRGYDTVIGIGSAGTGKSFIPLAMAAKAYSEREVDNIVITRPLVAVDDKELGYFKGDFLEKIAPWANAPLDNLRRVLGKQKVEAMVKHEEIMIRPLGYDRGVTYDNAFIILDEAQNATFSELQMLLTRMGDNSKLVLTGDLNQSDLHGKPGLAELTRLIERANLPVEILRFNSDDIVRSAACKMWVEAFDSFPVQTL